MYETPSPRFPLRCGRCYSPNSAPRHDDDAACRTFHQFGNERNPFHGIGLLAGSQDTVAAQLNQLLQCGKGIAANIKGAMTGDRQRFGRLDQPAHQRDIDIPVFRQATKDYAVHLQLLAQFDIQQHRLNLCRRIEEVASTRTDNHIYINRRSECLRRPDLPVAGCRSPFRDAGTKSTRFAPPASASTQLCAEFAQISIIRVGFIRILPLLFLLHTKIKLLCETILYSQERDRIA